MADVQKTDIPQVAQPEEPAPAVAAAPAVEPAKEETPAAPAVEATTVEEPAAATTDDKPAEEAKPEEKEEVKPIEEGILGHKAQGASFPK